ncbi:hypothetical protein BDD12DRAFT_984310 [Trichophaea hybrida]|nr:hypothetical protein BDD12DRAFT_984310 [Trichophaea hybrida]
MAKKKKNKGKAPATSRQLPAFLTLDNINENAVPVLPGTAWAATSSSIRATIAQGLENHNRLSEIAELKTAIAELQMTVTRLQARLEMTNAANPAPQLVPTPQPQPQPQIPIPTKVPIQPQPLRKTESLPIPSALRMVVVPLAKEELMNAKRKASAMEKERAADVPRTTAPLRDLIHLKHAIMGTVTEVIEREGGGGSGKQGTLVLDKVEEEVRTEVMIKRRKYYHMASSPGLRMRHPDGLGETLIWEREYGRKELQKWKFKMGEKDVKTAKVCWSSKIWGGDTGYTFAIAPQPQSRPVKRDVVI